MQRIQNSTSVFVSPSTRRALTGDYIVDGIESLQLPIATPSVLGSVGHESGIQNRNHT